jgi:16S rRNA (cytosine1402-N4)-methyltransferase
MEIVHIPVLLEEALEQLSIKEGEILIDCTIGEGGHSVEFLKKVGPEGFLIGIDLDSIVLKKCAERLSKVGANFRLVHGNFKDVLDFVFKLGFNKVDKIFADLGMSSFQLSKGDFGFSFRENGPLDMRMNKEMQFSAMDVINRFSEKKIASILWEYGEERFSRLIARKIVEMRKIKQIETTFELASIVSKAYPLHHRKIHPATRTFQALRIYVNNELENLSLMLDEVPEIIRIGGRIAIISYHSLEDRIVKSVFKKNPKFKILTKKVVKPKLEELKTNRRARSARMRVAERV